MIQRFIALLLLAAALPVMAAERPNVILIVTDDQGYGDIAAHGNPVLKTPNLDKLHSESIRLTDYHTDPTCSPTRAALLTGRYSMRTGVTHTINGRSLMHGDEYTMAEYFKDNGYRTGMFGKWHLGANAPMRPMDQGFDHCVWSPGGAVNQGANWLGNDCFDDTYKLNDQWQKFPGYHTDVWYEQAMKFIDDADTHGDKPFFIYLPTTAVHDPWNIEDEKIKPYLDAGVPTVVAKFYAMVTNIDDNVGKLRAFLKDKGLSDNTILIYTCDNGTAIGWAANGAKYEFFNAGMRAWKGSEYEGGHRVPFFMHWPAKGFDEGKDIETLTAHFDVLPTLVDLAKLDKPEGPKLDGHSWKRLLAGEEDALPERTIVVGVQRRYQPAKWDRTVAMQGPWRLVNGKELYHIRKDPGQQNNLADKRPEMVEILKQDYDKWWQDMAPHHGTIARFDLGGAENPTTLMSHDWYMNEGEGDSAWHHSYVNRNELRNGSFAVDIKKSGMYRITPMRWPEYVDKASGCTAMSIDFDYIIADITEPASIGHGTKITPDRPVPSIDIELRTGLASLNATLTNKDGKTFGAYYVKIEYLGEE